MPRRVQAQAAAWLYAALLAPALPAFAQGSNTEELKELRGRIDSLKRDIDRAEGNRAEAADSLRESERAISEANRALRDLSEQKKGAEFHLLELGR